MANICVLEIELSFVDSEDAKAFAESLEAELRKANKNKQGVYIGSERYLFEAEIDAPVNNKLLINGWVKWALSQEEAVKFIDFINGFRELVEAVIYYEETGECIYGKFIYKDCVLVENQTSALFGNTMSNNSDRIYIKFTANAVRKHLKERFNYTDDVLPSRSAISRKLNENKWHLKKVRKTIPKKKYQRLMQYLKV